MLESREKGVIIRRNFYTIYNEGKELKYNSSLIVKRAAGVG